MKALSVSKHPALVIIGLVLQLVMVITVPAADASESKTSGTGVRNLCYAFLRNGDLWTVCQGKRDRIADKLVDFAISADGSYLAFQENLERSGIGRTRQTLVSLNAHLNEQHRDLDYQESLYATCGTLVSVQFGNAQWLDLIGARLIKAPPYKAFRCSSKRETVAGWSEKDEEERLKRAQTDPWFSGQLTTLTVERSGRRSQVDTGDSDAFDVSPGGEYVAYFTTPHGRPGPDLCLQASNEKSSCVLGLGHRLAVSDSGEVIYASDEEGVRFWRPGLRRTILLEKGEDNDHPVWIAPQVALALHQWSGKRPIALTQKVDAWELYRQ